MENPAISTPELDDSTFRPLPSGSTAARFQMTEESVPNVNPAKAMDRAESDIDMSAKESTREYALAAPKPQELIGLIGQTPALKDLAPEAELVKDPVHEYEHGDEDNGEDEEEEEEKEEEEEYEREDEYDGKDKDEDEDLAELEELMVPPGMRSVYRSAYNIPKEGRMLANRLSKYSTGILTSTKWYPIENHQWKVVRGRSSGWHAINDDQWSGQATEASQRPSTDDAIEGRPIAYVDLPGQLAKLHKKPVEDLSKAEKHALAAELQVQQWSTETVLDPKYFDLDHYMEQAKSYKDDYPELPPKVDSTGQITSPVLLAPPEYYLKEPEPLDLTESKEIAPVEVTVPRAARKKNEVTPGKVKVPLPARKKKANNRRSEKEALKSTAETPDTVEADVTVQNMMSEDAETTTPRGDMNNSKLAHDSNYQWELVQGTTDVLHSGYPAPEALTIRLRQKVTGETETHVFQTLSPQVLNWNNRYHIADISRWRYNILHRRGITCDRVVMPYFPAEEAWLLLLHKKIKAVVEAGHNIKMPTHGMIVDGFNEFFQGQVLQDTNGHDLFPRDARDGVSIKGKLRSANSGVPRVREVTRKLLEGKKRGEMYMPVIRQDELRKYQEDGSIEIADFEDRKTDGVTSSSKRRREATRVEGSDAKRVKK